MEYIFIDLIVSKLWWKEKDIGKIICKGYVISICIIVFVDIYLSKI